MKNVEDVYPLTPLQQGMLFHALQGPAGGVYVERLSCTMRGDLDLAAFRQAWNAVLVRHPILRTAFLWEDLEDPLQIVRAKVSLPWHEEDWRHLSGAEQAGKLGAFLGQDLERGFRVEKAPLMRLNLFRLEERSWRLVWSHHHLVLDGWARVLVLRDVFQLYEAFRRGDAPELPIPRPFRDYVAWLQQQDLVAAEAFWRRELAGFAAPTPLGMARPGSAPFRPEGETGEHEILLPARLTARLQDLARRERLTLNTLLQGAWALLLSRSSGEPDVVFGTVVSGRPAELAGVESMVGLFINTLPVRVRLSSDGAVMPWLRLLQESQAAQRRYEFSPLVRVNGWSEVPRSAPLFESLFVFENHPASVSQEGTGGTLTVEDRRYEAKTHYPLTLIAAPGARLELRLQYSRERFDGAVAQRLLESLETLLQGFLREGLRTLSDLPVLTAPERHQLTVEWNDTERGFPAGATLHGLFEAQVERSPEAVALVWRGERTTYRELEERANRLAHHLRALGVGPEVVVGVFAERTPALVAALLAILKAGGAYLPLGLENPEERLGGLVGETAAPILLTQERLLPRLSWYRGTTILLDREDFRDRPATRPNAAVSDGHLSYVIYTSGSTGRPKGIAIEHRSGVTFVRWAAGVFPPEDLAGVLASTAIYFDLSVFELFVTLSLGGKLFLVDNILELAAFDGGGELTLINTVPSGITELLRLEAVPASVRTVNLAGEPLKASLSRQLYGLGSVRQVLNLYGPSEDTTYSTFARIDPDDGFPPIGAPIAGTQVQLLDRWLLPVPLGCVGEICLGGAGLARGYLGQPALTATRFIPDPFSSQPGARLYRTGDLARYRSSGSLEYLGRIDHQVKLRGFRIELGEIEAALLRHPRVRETVAVVRRDREDDPRLVAYVVPEPPEEALAARGALSPELRQHLQDRLPAYMVPSALVFLEALPLTPTGKVDRKALPDPGAPVGQTASPEHQEPRFDLEERIAGVWKELLGLDRIGPHDRLFDLGAHSLLMVRAFVKLKELVGARLTLVDLFKYPTIGSLVDHLESTPGLETLQLERGRERSESRSAAQGHGVRDVAIVGLRGRFPRARDLSQLWRNLCDGVEAVSFFSDEELRRRGVDATLLNDPNYVKAGYVLEDLEWFDAAFFGYSPREAEVMDPQQRLFLECAWEALEDAGYDPRRYPKAVGVFAGVSMSWYWMNLFSNPDLLAVQGTYQAMIGNDKDFLPTRVSYKLNLRGPSLNVQSACSTSLVAVHLACQSLLNGECDMALAGGVSASAQQGTGYAYTEGGIFSPDGHCRAFDAQARGTVAGSGLAVVVLKRLADAIADGDTIRAVIKGSAVNNDGSFKVGYSAPSVEGQANVIAEAQAVAGVSPETVTYVETHGTGTEVGDPIEIEALTAAWRQRTARKGFCALGAVKTNLGHLDAAAGVTGLVKAVLALQAGKIPPTLHFERPNPQIDLENSPFYVNDRLIDWVSEGPRRAGVSAFGLGGTNVHVVLEEAPPREPSGPSRPLQLLVLSTRTNLEAATDGLADFLRRDAATPLADVAYTLQMGRAQLDHRRVLVCRDREDALRALEARDPQRLLTLVQEPVGRRVVFLFPGGGAQYADMGLELYREEPVFREEVDRCLEILAPHLGLDLKPYLYPSLVAAAPGGALSRTSTALPALFVTEIALAKLWMSWGVRPQALIGHSLGEYAAAYLAGVMSLEDALALVALRGRLFETLLEGAMLSVPLPEEEVLPLLDERLSIAAINDVTQCVVSGPVEEIARLERELAARGLEVHKLHIEVAAHSSLVEPILEEFGAFLKTLRLQAPGIPFVSDVTGTWIRDEEATDPGYWVRQLRHTVRFAAGLDTLLDVPGQVFLEMGPGRILSSFVRRHPRKLAGHEVFTTLRHINDSVSDLEFTFNLLGRLWLIGQEIDWAGFYARERRHRVPLPTYPFDRQRYWVERRPEAIAGALSRRAPAKKPEVADWFYTSSWRLSVWPVAEPAEEPATWLLFADGHGLGRELAAALDRQGHQVVTVTEGAAFARLEEGSYQLDPASADGYDALLQDLCRRGGIPRRIVHLWSVTLDDPTASTLLAGRFDHAQERGFYSLLRLAQALLRQNVTDAVQLDVVADGLQRVDGGDAIDPGKATLLGICQVLPQEYDCFSCRAIDVVPRGGDRRDLANRLAAEISRPAGDRLVAFRGRRRWVRAFDPVRVEAPAGAPPALREEGIYLITGGLGRFGLSYARHLAGKVRARLILTGRSGLPPREEWPEQLERHGDDAVSHKIRRLQELEARGAEVEVVSADVADEAQMRAVIARARERFGGLHGVIHAAGLIGPETFRAIPETGPREAEAHFRPKIRGAAVLARVLDGLDMDFCLLISSISTVLGGLGFAAYSAANLALDAFAQERDAAGGTPWMSVGWDAWAEREDEERGRSAVGAELAGLAMAPEEGLEAFERCFSLLGVPQIVLSTGDLEARMRRWSHGPTGDGADPEAAAGPSSLHDRPSLPQPYVAPRDERERAVAELWQKLLGIQQIGVYDDFFELGGDSLRATQLASSLRRHFKVSIPLRALFDAPSVAGQVEVIAGLQAEQTREEAPDLARIQSHRRTLLDDLEDLELLPEEGLEPLWRAGEMSTSGGLE